MTIMERYYLNKNITKDIYSSYRENPKSTFLRDAYIGSISPIPPKKSNLSDEKVQIPCRAALAQGEPEIKNPDA